MPKIDPDWLADKGQAVRPVELPRALYARLKIVAGLVAEDLAAGPGGPRLLWRDERGVVMSLAVPRTLLIGRDAACGLTLASPRVSRRHCEITLDEGVAWVRDLGASNGTIHNGERLGVPAPLHDGDVIEAGGELFVYVAGNSGVSRGESGGSEA